MNWRDNLDKSTKVHIEKLIEESGNYKENYNLARDRGRAQLWVVIGILSKQIYNLKLKLDYLEKALQSVAGPKLKAMTEAKRKKEEKEIEKFIKELARGNIKKIKKKTKKKKIKKKIKEKSNKKNKRFDEIKIAKSL